MTCEEFKELVAGLALGTLEPEERAAAEAHLGEARPHAGCAAALERARLVATAPGQALPPVAPPARVWAGVVSTLGLPGPERAPEAPPALAWQRAAPWLVAVAAGLVAVMFWLGREREQARRLDTERALAAAQLDLKAQADQLLGERNRAGEAKAACEKLAAALRGDLVLAQSATAMMERAGTRVLAFAAQDPHRPSDRAAVVFNPDERRAIVVSTSLPRDSTRDYQLWVIRGKAPPAPAGLMHAGGNGITIGEVDAKLLREGPPPDAFAISVEPLGGAQAPSHVLMVAKASG